MVACDDFLKTYNNPVFAELCHKHKKMKSISCLVTQGINRGFLFCSCPKGASPFKHLT